MRFARFARAGALGYGVVDEAGASVDEISTTPFLPFERTGVVHALADVRLVAPCLPSKIVAIGLNYRAHAVERGDSLPAVPLFFFKPSTAVVGPGGMIVRPQGCKQLDYEGELAVVIGAVARGVDEHRWQEVVLGYTCAIDATARDLQMVDPQWGRAKGFDTSAPLGPWIETAVNPADLHLETRVNGHAVQDASTQDLLFSVPALIAYVTSYVTLLPGDVIMTGTPEGPGPVKAGDRVEVEISGIGTLAVGVSDRA
ncbi:MAG TPA: fumarylacetoacetate hydrolase family protein [Actinomycetota bacterium]|nr:fumarylacetoacetate hydrolase family protein [Actinomycetota bacterium]